MRILYLLHTNDVKTNLHDLHSIHLMKIQSTHKTYTKLQESHIWLIKSEITLQST